MGNFSCSYSCILLSELLHYDLWLLYYIFSGKCILTNISSKLGRNSDLGLISYSMLNQHQQKNPSTIVSPHLSHTKVRIVNIKKLIQLDFGVIMRLNIVLEASIYKDCVRQIVTPRNIEVWLVCLFRDRVLLWCPKCPTILHSKLPKYVSRLHHHDKQEMDFYVCFRNPDITLAITPSSQPHMCISYYC